MPCADRRGCAERFSGLPGRQLFAILTRHGCCTGCGQDVTDQPRFDGLVPYCPACYEERWPSGAVGPFERGQPPVYRHRGI